MTLQVIHRPKARHRTAVPVLAALSLWACDATDVGNPPAVPDDATASFQLVATGPSGPADGPIAHDGFWLDGAVVAIDDVSLTASSGDTVSSSTSGPVFLNAITGESVGNLALDLDATTYTSMTLTLAAAATIPDGLPAQLAGSGALIEGRRADGTRFIVTSGVLPPITLTGPSSGIEVLPGSQSLLLSLSTDEWFEAEELDELPAADPIVIDASTQPELTENFTAAFARSFALYRDTNANGALDIGTDEMLASGDEGDEETAESPSELQERETERIRSR